MRVLRREGILFIALAFVGIVLLPVAVYLVGKSVFGSYAGGDLFDFYGTLMRGLFGGDLSVLFLLSAPYLAWQTLRLTAAGFRRLSPQR